jgi:pimeloyl-ACP methyl ester carboxylesterase
VSLPAIWSATTGLVGGGHVVVVHGSLDRSAGMLKLSRRLDDEFRVTRYDRRGYGRSMPHPGPFGIEAQVADLVEVIRRSPLAPGRCVVFGHSYGGNVALALAERHHELVAGVVVYESPLSWLDGWPGASAGADARAWAHDPEQAAESFMRRLIGDQRWDRLPPATRDARRAEGPALVGELADLRRRAPWSVAGVTTPVLAMYGEHAADHHRQAMRVVGEWFACPAVAIPGARHFGPNTHPEAVADTLVPFARTCFGA